jgi:hypothetical protein
MMCGARLMRYRAHQPAAGCVDQRAGLVCSSAKQPTLENAFRRERCAGRSLKLGPVEALDSGQLSRDFNDILRDGVAIRAVIRSHVGVYTCPRGLTVLAASGEVQGRDEFPPAMRGATPPLRARSLGTLGALRNAGRLGCTGARPVGRERHVKLGERGTLPPRPGNLHPDTSLRRSHRTESIENPPCWRRA